MKTRAAILAGGQGSRLGVLTVKRAKPAVPFAGKYRIIDFTLSNCVNSGIFDVMIITQYRPHSLNDHIGAGNPWDLDRSFTGGVKLYQPYQGRTDRDWYAGTADAIQQNMHFVRMGCPDHVLVLGGDHIYRMNYDDMINFHDAHQADLTIAAIQVSLDEAKRMGVLAADDDHRVTQFVEKPSEPPGRLASMGIYVFNLDVLEKALQEDAQRKDSSHDFGKDVIPRLLQAGQRVFAYPFDGYWVDVGTLEAYWRTHMDLLQSPTPLDLNDRKWIIHTRSEERPPIRIADGAIVKDSLITDGSVIEPGALVQRSVLSPGVYVGPNAVVRDSIILTDTRIEAGACVVRAIVDKQVWVEQNARIGELIEGDPNPGLTVVGKSAHLPAGFKVGRQAVVGTDVKPEHLPRNGELAPGAKLEIFS